MRIIACNVLCFALAACGNRSSPTPALGSGAATSASTIDAFGWWVLPDAPGADDLRGGAMKLAATELVAITKDGRVFVRACATTVSGTTVTSSGCGPALIGTLSADAIAFPAFTMTRASAARAAELERVATAKRPPADICERALRCLRAVSGKADPKEESFELGGPPHDPSSCEGYLKGMAMLDDQHEPPLPPACAPR